MPVTERTCPECGSELEIVRECPMSKTYAPAFHVAGRPLPRRISIVLAALCTGCEFAIEIRRP